MAVALCAATMLAACGDGPRSGQGAPTACGDTYRVNQGICSGFGHSGFWRYGYDFEMPTGTIVTAARAGIVVHARDGAQDGDRSNTKLITVEHADGSVGVYSHLTLNGVLVTVGQSVLAGDTIGLSGETGNTGGLPQRHFSLHPCASLPGLPGGSDSACPTIFVNFRNTIDNTDGLLAGRSYEALLLQ